MFKIWLFFKIHNIKVVEFKSGEFGIRSGFIEHRFLDIVDIFKKSAQCNWRLKTNTYFKDCRCLDKEKVQQALKQYIDFLDPVSKIIDVEFKTVFEISQND